MNHFGMGPRAGDTFKKSKSRQINSKKQKEQQQMGPHSANFTHRPEVAEIFAGTFVSKSIDDKRARNF